MSEDRMGDLRMSSTEGIGKVPTRAAFERVLGVVCWECGEVSSMGAGREAVGRLAWTLGAGLGGLTVLGIAWRRGSLVLCRGCREAGERGEAWLRTTKDAFGEYLGVTDSHEWPSGLELVVGELGSRLGMREGSFRVGEAYGTGRVYDDQEVR